MDSTFWTTFAIVLGLYVLYYTLTPGGRKAWKEAQKPKKTKEQYRQEWEEGEQAMKEVEKYYELKNTILQQELDKQNKK